MNRFSISFFAQEECSQRLLCERVLITDHTLHSHFDDHDHEPVVNEHVFHTDHDVHILERFPHVWRILCWHSGMEFLSDLHQWHASHLQVRLLPHHFSNTMN